MCASGQFSGSPKNDVQCRCVVIRIRDLENEKSEPNALLVKTLQYLLSSLNSLLLFLSNPLGFFGGLLCFLFLRVASCQLNPAALVSALDSTKFVCYEGPATLSSPYSIAKKHCSPPPTSHNSILHTLMPPVMHKSVMLEFLSEILSTSNMDPVNIPSLRASD